MGTTSATAPIAFTGVSTYSSDFQSILTRAVNIASLPLTQLQNQDTDLAASQTQLSTFGDSITALSASFESLTAAVSTSGISASSSDSTTVTATRLGSTDDGQVHDQFDHVAGKSGIGDEYGGFCRLADRKRFCHRRVETGGGQQDL